MDFECKHPNFDWPNLSEKRIFRVNDDVAEMVAKASEEELLALAAVYQEPLCDDDIELFLFICSALALKKWSDEYLDRAKLMAEGWLAETQPERPEYRHRLELFKSFFMLVKQENIEMDEKQSHRTLADRNIRLMSMSLKRDICDLRTPGALTTDIDNDRVTRYIPPRLRYACINWVQHLQMGCATLSDDGQVHRFLREHVLHWIESLSLMKKVSDAMLAISCLEAMAPANSCPNLHTFILDTKRFSQHNRTCIEHAPLQIYYSALIFAPMKSIIRKQFEDQMPRWIQRLPTIQGDWNDLLQTREGHSTLVTAVAMSEDYSQLASASADCTVILWDKATGAAQRALKGHLRTVNVVTFSPDGRLLGSASSDYIIKVWNTSTGAELQTLEGHSSLITAVAFSPDGKQLAAASDDHTASLWDLTMGSTLQTFKGHSGRVKAVALSPDGRRLATTSDDCTVRLWDTISGAVLQTLEIDTVIRKLSFSYDGSYLMTDKEVVHIASLPLGKVTQPYFAPTIHINAPTFVEEQWIGRDSENLLWLPSDYRATSVAISASRDIVFLGHESGYVSIFEFTKTYSDELAKLLSSIRSKISIDTGHRPPDGESTSVQPQNEIPPPRTWYEYERLDGFRTVRFIKLEPKRTISPHDVYIQLYPASLEDKISYCTLSYAWGTPVQSERVICNSQSLKVTPNLLAALTAIRDEYCSGEPLILWVDAICINQSDFQERKEQVQRMRSIYRGAQKVIAWIGEDTKDSDLAIDLLGKFYRLWETNRDNPGRPIRNLVQIVGLPDLNSPIWQALDAFMDRPFHKRIWIVQEIVSAKACDLLIGEKVLDWEWFSIALQGCYLYEFEVYPSAYIPGVRSFRSISILKELSKEGTSEDFLGVLECTRHFRSTDPLDKVYAVSSLSDSYCATRIVPDYTLSPAEVFPQVARLLIKDYNSLDVLCAVSQLSGLLNLRDYKLPSWAPDWTVFGGARGGMRAYKNRYRAAGRTFPSVRKHENPCVLSVKGYIIDSIKELGVPRLESLIEGQTLEGVFSNWVNVASESTGGRGMDTVDYMETLASTMIGGRGPSGEYPMTQSQVAQRTNEFIAWIYTEHSDEFPEERVERNTRADVSNYRHWFDIASLLNVFTVTAGGHFGLAPAATEEGDLVCILLGGSMPFVMRAEGDEWQLIGAAYVHGLMDGEALEREGLELTFFNIH